MPTPSKGPRLGGGPAHERLILANLAASLVEHKRITTTVTRAKRLQPFAERLVTFAKRGDLHARRRVLALMHNKDALHVLFTDVAPAMEGRDGGYTRITKIGMRKGDAAPMAVIELIMEPVKAKKAAKPAAKEATEPATDEAAAPAVIDITADAAAEVEGVAEANAEVEAQSDEATADVSEQADEVAEAAAEAVEDEKPAKDA